MCSANREAVTIDRHVMPALLDEEMGRIAGKHLKAKGVNLVFGAAVHVLQNKLDGIARGISPLGALRNQSQSLPRDKDILAFCKVSMRGYEAQRILQAQGFDRVRFMEGGILGWPFELIGTKD